MLKAIDADRINRSLDGVQKFADALGKNAGSVDRMLADAAEITRKVNGAADRLDSVMKAAESFLVDPQGKSLMAEFGETAKAIRLAAGNFDKRMGEISGNLKRFTGPGLRDMEALTGDARKAVNDVSRAVKALEKNPSQIITGGRSSIPEYGGSR